MIPSSWWGKLKDPAFNFFSLLKGYAGLETENFSTLSYFIVFRKYYEKLDRVDSRKMKFHCDISNF